MGVLGVTRPSAERSGRFPEDVCLGRGGCLEQPGQWQGAMGLTLVALLAVRFGALSRGGVKRGLGVVRHRRLETGQ